MGENSFDISNGMGLGETLKAKKQEKQEKAANLARLATAPPNITNLKLYIESVLEMPNYEEILFTLVEDLNKTESVALNDETKAEIAFQKRILGFVFTHANAFGDQYSVLNSLATQLGYRKIMY